MKLVVGSRSSSSTPRVRSPKASRMPDSERKKADRSLSMSTPVTRAKIAKTSPVERPNTRAARPPGERNTLQRASFEEAQQPARRLEEVDRVARWRRVEHDHVEVVLVAQLVQLGHRAQLLRARDRRGQLAVDRVRQDLLAFGLVLAQARDDFVERALAVEHHRPQLALALDASLGEQRRVDRRAARPRAAPVRARLPGARPGRS